MDAQVKLPSIGWREWIALPDLGIPIVKAKIDTGARSSALHAFAIEPYEREGATWLRFEIHPHQRDDRTVVRTAAPLLDRREVRSSNGQVQLRYAISTAVMLGDCSWPIELTLTNRDAMGFRLLLGRQALRDRFLVHSGQSFLHGKPLSSAIAPLKTLP